MTIGIEVDDVMYDVRANTWKTGRLAPREDGLHGETQISSDEMDNNVVYRLFAEALSFLFKDLQEFNAWSNVMPSDIKGGGDFGPGDNFQITVTPNSRNNTVVSQAQALSHEYVIDYILAGWYQMVDPDREGEWRTRLADTRLRLLSALRYKTEPV